jgi:hypothetical protein
MTNAEVKTIIANTLDWNLSAAKVITHQRHGVGYKATIIMGTFPWNAKDTRDYISGFLRNFEKLNMDITLIQSARFNYLQDQEQ